MQRSSPEEAPGGVWTLHGHCPALNTNQDCWCADDAGEAVAAGPGRFCRSVCWFVVVRCQSHPHAVLPQRPCDGQGTLGGIVRRGGVGCGRGGDGGGVDLRRRPRNLLRTPPLPLRYCPPRPSTAPSSQPSSVLERSAAESLARTLVALVRCKFALPVEFSQRHSVSDRTTNACVSGPPLFQTVAPPPKQGLRPVDSTTVADTQAPKSTRDQARVPHDLG